MEFVEGIIVFISVIANSFLLYYSVSARPKPTPTTIFAISLCVAEILLVFYIFANALAAAVFSTESDHLGAAVCHSLAATYFISQHVWSWSFTLIIFRHFQETVFQRRMTLNSAYCTVGAIWISGSVINLAFPSTYVYLNWTDGFCNSSSENYDFLMRWRFIHGLIADDVPAMLCLAMGMAAVCCGLHTHKTDLIDNEARVKLIRFTVASIVVLNYLCALPVFLFTVDYLFLGIYVGTENFFSAYDIAFWIDHMRVYLPPTLFFISKDFRKFIARFVCCSSSRERLGVNYENTAEGSVVNVSDDVMGERILH